MPPILCPDRQQLEAYATGRMRLDLADRLAEHLDVCNLCETAVAGLERAADRLLARLRAAPPADSLDQEPQCKRMLQLLGKPEVAGLRERSIEPTSAMPGNFRDYQLLQKLGEGGMGAVYKARHTRLNKLVAIKFLSPGMAAQSQYVARFQREMSAVGKLDHPHIVRATDAGQAEGRQFLVMEFLDGLNLSEVVAHTGPLRIPDACEVIRQAALGLCCADEHGLIHRDIKPSNLMLTPEGQVKILDLGLAMFEAEHVQGEEATAFGQVIGTADYIAPEQVSDARAVDIRADIYSLGCTFYKLLTGQPPFAGPRYKNNFEKITAHVRDPVPPLSDLRADVPEQLADIVERMLIKDRDLRIPAPGRLIAALEPFCAGSDLVGLFALARKSPRVESAVEAAPGNPPGGKPPVAVASKSATPPAFDPYYKWLGIPPEEQPPDHYRLLAIRVFEQDVEVIRDAVEQRMAHVRTYHLGPQSALSQRILNELAAAKVALLDPARKLAYDARLRQQLQRAAVRQTQAAAMPERPAEAKKVAETEEIDSGVATLFAEIERERKAPQPSDALRRRPSTRRSKLPPLRLIAVAGGAAAALLILWGIIVSLRTSEGTLVVEIDEPGTTVKVLDGQGNVSIERVGVPKGPLTIGIDPGKHRLRVEKDGFIVFAKDFSIASGKRETIRARLEPLVTASPPAVPPESSSKLKDRA